MKLDQALINKAIQEDIGTGDISAALIPINKVAQAKITTREAMVLCGQHYAEAIFKSLDDSCKITWLVTDGEFVPANTVLCEIDGNARNILTAERIALNFLQTLSGTATLTKRYVSALHGTQTKILDTRKTLPGMRQVQKYAVQCGGGENHRYGLYDAILIKENHINAAGSIQAAVDAISNNQQAQFIEVEVEDLDQLEQALAAGVTRILLDNFSLANLKQAVELNQGRATLEASGNITFESIKDVAETGVDYISLGALTKNVTAIDLSLLFKA